MDETPAGGDQQRTLHQLLYRHSKPFSDTTTDSGQPPRCGVVAGVFAEQTPAGWAVTELAFGMMEVEDKGLGVLRAFPHLLALEFPETSGLTPAGLAHL